MDARTPQADIVEYIATKYAIFNPADKSPGFSARLRAMLDGMDRHRDEIERTLEYTPGTHNFDVLVDMIMQGQLTFWDLPNGFFLTEVQLYPLARHFHVFMAGGELQALIDLHDDMLMLASALGCSRATIAGREGWGRVFRDRGWKKNLTVISKEIS